MLHKWPLRRVCALLLITAALFRLAAETPRASAGELAADALLLLGFGNTGQAPEEPSEAPTARDYPLLAYAPRADEPLFTPEDADELEIDNVAGADFDTAALLTATLDFDNSGTGPKILIVHTHATEAYADTPDYRTEDTSQNVVQVGQALTDALNALGIETLHHTGLNDLAGYNGAYERMELTINDYLARYPSICMVIDLHRDAALDADGNQVALRTELAGQSAARLLLVMGSDVGGLPHPDWQDNLALALKLQCLGGQTAPGLFRPLNLRAQRYNQHLCPNSLLLEVGAAGNSLEEALRSAEFFAQLLAAVVENG